MIDVLSSRLYLTTWNVKEKAPYEDLSDLLGFAADFYGADQMPDAIAVGLQEVHTGVSNLVIEEPWIKALRNALGRWGYVKMRHVRLQGIILSLFVKSQHVTTIRGIETETTKTGFGGVWGNKGGVSIRFRVNGACSVVITNSHLAAFDDQLEQRITDFNSIIDDQSFRDQQTPNILSHE